VAKVPKSSIAILGWGSLLWDDNEKFDSQHGPWFCDGPKIKIEFSRISCRRKNALTLVIDIKNGQKVEVSYCLSKRTELVYAIKDLEEREESRRIGFTCVKSGLRCSRHKFVESSIAEWAKSKSFEQVIWTDLESNFLEEKKIDFTVDNAVAHIKGLTKEGRYKAAEYIFNAPAYVQTSLRTKLMNEPWFCDLKPAEIKASPC